MFVEIVIMEREDMGFIMSSIESFIIPEDFFPRSLGLLSKTLPQMATRREKLEIMMKTRNVEVVQQPKSVNIKH